MVIINDRNHGGRLGGLIGGYLRGFCNKVYKSVFKDILVIIILVHPYFILFGGMQVNSKIHRNRARLLRLSRHVLILNNNVLSFKFTEKKRLRLLPVFLTL